MTQVVATVLFALAGVLSLGISLAAANATAGLLILEALAFPGRFLLVSFHWAAVFVPVYLLAAALLLVRRGFGGGALFLLTASIVPFLTVSLFLKLVTGAAPSPAVRIYISAFGTGAGGVLLALLFALEIVVIARLYVFWFRDAVESAPEHAADAHVEWEPVEWSENDGEDLADGDEAPVVDAADHRAPGPARREFLRIQEAREGEAFRRAGERTAARQAPLEEFVAEDAAASPEPADAPVEAHEPGGFALRFPDLPQLPELRVVHRAGSSSASMEVELPEDRLEDVAAGGNDGMLPEPPAGEDHTADSAEAGGPAPEVAAPPEGTTAAAPIEEQAEPIRGDAGVSGPADTPRDHYELDEIEEEPDSREDPLGEPAAAADYGEADEVAEEAYDDDGETDAEALARMEPSSAVYTGRRRRGRYKVPVDGLLNEYEDGAYWEIDDETRRAAEILKSTLEEFRIKAEVTGIRKGPVITMFEILPAPGVKLSKITNLADNIALRLAASRVRIVAPIPGKHAVGIEVPNKHRAVVSFREMLAEKEFTKSRTEIPVALGKDIAGEAQIVDLVQMPHLLIAGATGSGKSVCVNSIICSILYRRAPDEVRLMLIDPKIVELKFYNDIPHLLTPVITDPKRAFQALQYALYEMERRYSLLDALGVRDIRSYNRKIETKRLATVKLPYIVIVVDEFADLMATTGKELESTLARLAAMSRAVGIHLVLATQRPSIDVITGLIKANIPSRIAFMVASKFDSRIIIDGVGAEKLLGKGDMLFATSWLPGPIRVQGALLTEDEVEQVADYVRGLGEPDYIDDEIFIDEEEGEDVFRDDEDDPLMDKALEIVVGAGKASASYLQRRLKIGYNRAARLVEDMEHRGIVGPQNGSKPREILHVPDRPPEG